LKFEILENVLLRITLTCHLGAYLPYAIACQDHKFSTRVNPITSNHKFWSFWILRTCCITRFTCYYFILCTCISSIIKCDNQNIYSLI